MAAEIKNPLNAPLVGHFARLGGMYSKLGEKSRSGTFYRVATLVSGLEDHVDKEYDITQHAGCGGSTATEVKEFLESGSSKRLTELAMRPDMPVETLNDKIARLLVVANPKLDGSRVGADLILCVAINGMSNLDQYISGIANFDQYMIDAGLEKILSDIKANPNM